MGMVVDVAPISMKETTNDEVHRIFLRSGSIAMMMVLMQIELLST